MSGRSSALRTGLPGDAVDEFYDSWPKLTRYRRVRAQWCESAAAAAILTGRRVTNLAMPAGGPLTAEAAPACHASVKKSRHHGHWALRCSCGVTGSFSSWQRAYRRAYRHVRLRLLLDAVAAMDQEMAVDCE